jgi:uncharacterized protein YndB with AHSA1/START domain
MRVEYVSEHDLSSAKAATGKALDEWFQVLDAMGGAAKGRKELGALLMKDKVEAWWITTLLVEYEKTRGVTEKDGFVKGYNICVTKSIAAAPEQVYEALRDVSWWLGAKTSADVKDGGSFDDGEGHFGSFKKLTPGKLLRFSWSGPGHQTCEGVEIKLTAAAGKTSIVLNHERLPDRAAADGMRSAWVKVLENLKARLA